MRARVLPIIRFDVPFDAFCYGSNQRKTPPAIRPVCSGLVSLNHEPPIPPLTPTQKAAVTQFRVIWFWVFPHCPFAVEPCGKRRCENPRHPRSPSARQENRGDSPPK